MASTYLTRTPSSTGSQQRFTLSFWWKTTPDGQDKCLFSSGLNSSNYFMVRTTGAETLQILTKDNGNTGINYQSSQSFRDANAWYHIVLTIDTTQAGGNRIKYYVNGERVTSFASNIEPNQHSNILYVNDTTAHAWGRKNVTADKYLNGSLSHVHFIDGTAYDASAFGETDSTTGEWKIKTSPSVTYGTNGYFILKDGNSVTDQSGNGNNFTVGGGTLTNTEDCPSNVFATWNPNLAMNSTMTLANGNTTGTTGSNYAAGASNSWWSTLGMSSGKYYCEIKMSAATANQGEMVGVGYDLSKHQRGSSANAYNMAYIAEGWGYFGAEGKVKNNNSDVATGLSTWTTNDIIGIAIDMDNNNLYFHKNGTYQNSGVPTSGSTGTGAISLTSGKTYFFGCSDASMSNTNTFQANFGNGYFGTTAVSSAGTNASGIGIFEYDVPTGYTALSTKGLNE